MRIKWWIPKATSINSGYVIITAVPLYPCLHKLASKLHYTYIACLVRIQNICPGRLILLDFKPFIM